MTPDSEDYRFAGGAAIITPSSDVPLAGYDGTRRSSRIDAPLEANAIHLTSGSQRLLFVSLDLLFVGAELQAEITRVASEAGIPANHIIVVASHTHFAPGSDRSKPLLGPVEEAWLSRARAQVGQLVKDVISAPLVPIRIRHVSAETQLNTGRRRRWPLPIWTRRQFSLKGGIVSASAPRQPRDRAIDALSFMNAEGSVVAVIWKYACHPVMFPDLTAVSPEFPGVAREEVRARFGRSTPVVFLQGFAGDVRPALDGRRGLGALIHSWRRGPGFGSVTMQHWRDWAKRVSEALMTALASGRSSGVSGGLSVRSASIPLGDLIEPRQEVPATAMEVRDIRMGQDLRLVCIAAEVCSPYVDSFGGAGRTLHVGYLGDVFGYLPSQDQVREGGYEAGGFFGPFSLGGRFRPGFERRLRETLKDSSIE
jgi:hypothetical protein